MELAAIFREFAQAAGPAAVTALWQSAVLVLGLAVCLRIAPRMSAKDRFRVWAAGFAAAAALPFFAWVLSFLFVAVDASGTISVAGAGAQAHPWLDLNLRWCIAIAGVWLIASVARLADLVVHSYRLRGLWKRAVPLADFVAANALDLSSAKRLVEVCATREVDRPSVIGFFRPRILIPEWLLERLTPAELNQVVLHEAEHLRRRDDWTNLLQKLCLVVFPLNPALAWMERRLCSEREMACDEGVLRRTHSPRAYAACLASLAERRIVRRAEALSLGAWRRRPELAERVHRILRRGPGLHPIAARALLGVMGCGLVFGSVELVRCPQLVAFAARPAAQQKVADAVLRDSASQMVNTTAYMTRDESVSGFRAVNAVARVPSRNQLAATAKRPRNFAANQTRWRNPKEAGPLREAQGRLLTPVTVATSAQDDGKTETHGIAASTVNAPQQWVLFTAWEQVESITPASQGAMASKTSADSAQSVATEAAASPEAAVAQYTVARQYTVTQRFAVTRLILRIYPVAAKVGANSATGPKSESDTGSATNSATSSKTTPTPVPLARVPVPDGWLILQL